MDPLKEQNKKTRCDRGPISVHPFHKSSECFSQSSFENADLFFIHLDLPLHTSSCLSSINETNLQTIKQKLLTAM